MKITDRYASAVRSSCLTVDERTTYSDTDVLASMGCADMALSRGKDFHGNDIPKAPLATALQRLFLGDNHAAEEIVEVLSEMAWKRARTLGVKLKRVQAEDLAKACLAWHRDGSCKSCGGHGVLVIRGTKTLGDQKCPTCKGYGRVPLERRLAHEQRDLARWLVAEMERDQAKVGPEAMRWIAPRLEL